MKTSEPPRLTQFLSYLAFEGPGLRVGIEITLIVFLHGALLNIVPVEEVGARSLVSWFCACSLVALVDQLLLSRPVYVYRASRRLDVTGAYQEALSLLETIGPKSLARVRCPTYRYHLQRALILGHAERFFEAEEEIRAALEHGLPEWQGHLTRCEIAYTRGNIERAQAELEKAELVLGDRSDIRLYKAFILFFQGEDIREAKRAFQAVFELPFEAHSSGETTWSLAEAFVAVCKLSTGYAEEGIEELSGIIARLRLTVVYGDQLRPLLALLLLERGLYFATHKEPERAIEDLESALPLCGYAYIQARSEEIKEELAWRHGVDL